MYYDEAPATDARHARTTLNDLTKELREFSEAHRDARRSDETGSRERANRARGRLIVEYERLKVLQHNFPIEFRERINTLLTQSSQVLEACPELVPVVRPLMALPAPGRVSQSNSVPAITAPERPELTRCYSDIQRLVETKKNPSIDVRLNDLNLKLTLAPPHPLPANRSTLGERIIEIPASDQSVRPKVPRPNTSSPKVVVTGPQKVTNASSKVSAPLPVFDEARNLHSNSLQQQQKDAIANKCTQLLQEGERRKAELELKNERQKADIDRAIFKQMQDVSKALEKDDTLSQSEASVLSDWVDWEQEPVHTLPNPQSYAHAVKPPVQLNPNIQSFIPYPTVSSDRGIGGEKFPCEAVFNPVNERFETPMNQHHRTNAGFIDQPNYFAPPLYTPPLLTPQVLTPQVQREIHPRFDGDPRPDCRRGLDAGIQSPHLLAPNVSPFQPIQTTPPPATNSHQQNVSEELMKATAQNLRREMLVSSRPPKDKRFSGDDKTIDFESYFNKFNLVTADEEITDHMRFIEMGHWFVGSAGEVVSMFELVPDASEALQGAKEKLRNDFGRQKLSATAMIEELLKGKKISSNETKRLQTFVLSLERTYMKACQTGRKSTFDTPDLINSIIRQKLEFVSRAWSAKRVKLEEKAGADENLDMDFKTFLKFLRRELKIIQTDATVLGSSSTPSHAPETKTAQNFHRSSEQRPKQFSHAYPVDAEKPKDVDPQPVSKRSTKKTDERPQDASKTDEPVESIHVGESKPSGREWICGFCQDTTFHYVTACPAYLAKTTDERFQALKAAGRCRLCLARGHMVRECTRMLKCQRCNGRHHTTIHQDRLSQEEHNEDTS